MNFWRAVAAMLQRASRRFLRARVGGLVCPCRWRWVRCRAWWQAFHKV